MSDEEGNKGRQSKEERAAMKNAARSQRSAKARALLANLIHEQHKIDIEPSKITSTKYVRELGLKFVTAEEQAFPWPYISTSQISSQDLAQLEAAIANAKVTAVKDDMYNTAAQFRSRSSISTPSRPNLSPTSSFSFHDPHGNPPPDGYRIPPPSLPPLQTQAPPPPSPHSHSRLNSLAEASSAQASATSAHPSSANPAHHWTGAAAAVSTSTHISSPPEAPPVGSVSQTLMNEARGATGFASSNPRKRMYPFDSLESHVEEDYVRVKIPRSSIKDILEGESAAHLARIRDLESRVADLERDADRQNKEVHRLRNENERLRKDLTLQGGDEMERLRVENEHLKVLGRKLFE
ncbi:hypothetical protein TWF481_000408 [Arthrobotrys musiformis]|uniref:BZIP domain-containing protein n=1 Tax=Arthrobotrys musiformis TaxID=47236 RepID=A0AAV9WMU8_9PEZI